MSGPAPAMSPDSVGEPRGDLFWIRPLAQVPGLLHRLPGRLRVLEWDTPLSPEERRRFDRHSCAQAHLKPKDCGEIERTAAAIATTWSRQADGDASEHDGMPLGRIFDREIHTRLVPVLKILRTITRLRTGRRCAEFLYLPATEPFSLAARVLEAGGFTIRRLPGPSSDVTDASPAGFHGRASSLIEILRDTWRHPAGCRIRTSSPPGPGPARTVFIQDSPRLLAYARAVLARPGGRLINHLPLTAADLLRTRFRLPLLRRRFRSRWKTLRHRIEGGEGIRFDGWHLGPALVPMLSVLMSERLPDLACRADAVIAALRRCRPDLVLVVDDFMEYNRSLILAAKRLGIRTASQDHCVWTPGTQYYIPSLTDEIWCWGENNRRFHIQNGYPPEQIRLAGNPAGEELVHAIARHTPAEARRMLGLPPMGRLALFLDSAYGLAPCASSGYRVLRILTHVVRAFRRLPDFRLAVKCHPGMEKPMAEGPGAYAARLDVIRRYGSDAVTLLPLETPLPVALKAADVAMVTFSTTGYEACLADVPLILVDFFPNELSVPAYAASGGAFRVRCPRDLSDAVRRVSTDESIRRALAEGRRRLREEIAVDTPPPEMLLSPRIPAELPARPGR